MKLNKNNKLCLTRPEKYKRILRVLKLKSMFN